MINTVCTKGLIGWLDRHPKTKQWVWFVALWCFGLLSVATLTYPIKWLMRML